jgi:hypothetical protein
MNENWIALVKAIQWMASTYPIYRTDPEKDFNIMLEALQAVINMLGPHDECAKELMYAYNCFTDGHWSAGEKWLSNVVEDLQGV